jgi:tetratricopeptide (TPR) repeat protein
MIAQNVLTGAPYRLAHHYINKLQQADSATRHGFEYRTHWLHMINQDWMQIKKWQDWSTKWTEQDVERANCCISFVTVSRSALEMRQTSPERVAWLKPALAAARELNDLDAEHYILSALAHAYMLMGNYDEANFCIQEILQTADLSKDDPNIANAHITLGNMLAQRGKLDDAESAFQKSLDIFERLGGTLNIARAVHKLGQVSHNRGEYQRAFEYHTRYFALVESTGHEGHLAVALDSLSLCLRSMGDYNASKDYAQRAVDICRRIGYTTMLPPTLFSVGSCEIELGNLEVSAIYYTEGVEIARLNANPSFCVTGLDNLGYIYAHLGDYERALGYFNEALALAHENHLTMIIFELRYDITNTQIMAGDLDAAKIALRELLDIAVSINTDRYKAKAISAAVALWHQLGNQKEHAVWVGLLTQYARHLEPSLFEPIRAALENELDSGQYQKALGQGKVLTLDEVLANILRLLD